MHIYCPGGLMKNTFICIIVGLAVMTLSAVPTYSQITWYSYVGNPVLTQAIEPAVLYDSAGQVYRMWFIQLGRGIVDAESPDGLNWFVGDSVVLEPGAAGSYDQYIHAVSVIKIAGTYVMYYTASRDGAALCIGRAVSVDARHWQKNPGTAVLSPGDSAAWDSRSVGGAKFAGYENGKYRMWFGGYNGVNLGTGLASSTDGIVWKKDTTNPVLNHGAPGSYDATEAGVMALGKRDSLYYMIYRSIGASSGMTFSLATSSDGIKWWKYPGNPVKRRGNSWDAAALGSGTLVWINGRFDLWYCGSDGYNWSIGVAMDEFVPLSVNVPGDRIPERFQLMQNYPNPFNPSTLIRYALPVKSRVTLSVYNTLGQEISSMVCEVQGAGYHEIRYDAANLASGVYIYRLQAGSFVQSRRFILIK
jgi:predicted GH43/DUF377 family glycosyl hydrolase